jgi:hypothetical protein
MEAVVGSGLFSLHRDSTVHGSGHNNIRRSELGRSFRLHFTSQSIIV